MTKNSSYSGRQKHIRGFKTPKIDTFENIYPDKAYTVSFETGEFTCVCPKTGLPDFATLYIDYVPDKKCLELKSFKEYLISYRSLGIFHENVVNKILEDIVAACKPRSASVVGNFNIRGGIGTRVRVEYRNPKS